MLSFIKANEFYPIMDLPSNVPVFDLSQGSDLRNTPGSFGIGRYNEMRENIYTADLFQGVEGVRNIHLGIDISAPVGTPIYAFHSGKILYTHYNSSPGDYGYTLVTEHEISGRNLFALWGHLQKKSNMIWKPGMTFAAGDILAWVGDFHENGGWPPHLHFQISWQRPESCDMPGVCSEKDRAEYLSRFPDPRLVLSPELIKLIDAPQLLE